VNVDVIPLDAQDFAQAEMFVFQQLLNVVCHDHRPALIATSSKALSIDSGEAQENASTLHLSRRIVHLDGSFESIQEKFSQFLGFLDTHTPGP
jgi:hypothetical protein